ncbi:hypothetical protein [Alloalcanivorax xenomutans]|uniref:hypothetical protein n=1 Tax=Alloalcanivorax xenomutans TaxID=1094342 RepID=UPI0024E1B877|nr:hypothetical protein [Alloalcanivorax xenomutans]
MPIEHWMQFSTFAEQDYFIYPDRETYDGIVLNANMIAHASNGIASFLLSKKAVGTKYIIDPMTHAFQHDPRFVCNNKNEPKASIRLLSELYGKPVLDVAGKRPATIADFESGSVLKSFSKGVVDFQNEYLNKFMQENESYKYFLEEDKRNLSPFAFVAPYFYVSELDFDEISNLNVRFSEAARELVGEAPVYAFCVVSQGVISDDSIREEVARVYCSMPVDGYFVWVDSLNEREASGTELRGLLDLCTKLRAGGTREVVNLHGGYFSIISGGEAGGSCLTGVCHGPEFGESRGVVPVGGGIPIARYYLPDVYSREKYRDVLRIILAAGWLRDAETFHQEICSCDECRATLDGDVSRFSLFGDSDVKNIRRRNGIVRIDFPTTETKRRCLRHYLQCKKKEFGFANAAGKEEVFDGLDRNFKKWNEVAGSNFASHLKIWKKVLKEYS